MDLGGFRRICVYHVSYSGPGCLPACDPGVWAPKQGMVQSSKDVFQPVARESGPLHNKWCNPQRRIGGFEYWRPGGLEALSELVMGRRDSWNWWVVNVV